MTTPPSHRRSTIALWIVFFVNGAVLASWAPRIPLVAGRLDLTDAQIGWALFGVAAGSIPALILTARALRRIAPRTLCIAAALVFPAALPLLAVAPTAGALGGALAVLGAASGCLDVAMNTAAIDHQTHTRTPVLSRLHGGYSLGALAGATSGAAASTFGVSVAAHFLTVATVLVALAAAAAPFLPARPSVITAAPPAAAATAVGAPALGSPRSTPSTGRTTRAAIPSAVAVMAIAALSLEGTVTDWTALLLSRDLGAGPTTGAVAIVVFSCAMFLSPPPETPSPPDSAPTAPPRRRPH